MISILAYISMLIDHTGAVFFPDNIYLRIIGRYAMPAFMFMASRGLLYTKDQSKYLFRLLLIAIISQIPFNLMHHNNMHNICFSILYGVMITIIIQHKQKKLLLLLPIILTISLLTEYHWYSTILIPLFYKYRHNKQLIMFLYSTLTLIYSILYNMPLQLLSIPFVLLIINLKKIEKKLRYRYPRQPYIVKYSFYPIHMLVLVGFQRLLL
jgi:hypothetical protein